MGESIQRVQTPPSAQSLARESRAVRRRLIEALFACGGGHYGGSLSVIDLLLALYRTQLRGYPGEPRHPLRDRLILSKGHAALALYAVQHRVGLLHEPLESYGSFGSPLEGHPDMTVLRSVDFSTGSLGQGLAVGTGMALALDPQVARTTRTGTRPATNRVGPRPRVWVVLGDGECQEGQVWEAAMIAARYRLDNLIAVIDANGFQEWGWGPSGAGDAEPVPSLEAKWRAFGWRTMTIDGHDFGLLVPALTAAARSTGCPTVVIAETVKGKGVPLAETDPIRFHCTEVSGREHDQMLAALEGG